MNDTIREASAWTLADLATDTLGSPDAQDSAGAKWLTELRDAAVEAFDADDNNETEDDWREVAFHLVSENEGDAPYIIGTHSAWEVFVDLCAYRVDFEHLVPTIPATDLNLVTQYALTEVALQVMTGVLEALAEEAGEAYVCGSKSTWTDGDYVEVSAEGTAIDAWQFLARNETDARMREVEAIERDDSQAVHAFYTDHGLNNDEGSKEYGTGEIHGIYSTDGMTYSYQVYRRSNSRA